MLYVKSPYIPSSPRRVMDARILNPANGSSGGMTRGSSNTLMPMIGPITMGAGWSSGQGSRCIMLRASLIAFSELWRPRRAGPSVEASILHTIRTPGVFRIHRPHIATDRRDRPKYITKRKKHKCTGSGLWTCCEPSPFSLATKTWPCCRPSSAERRG